MRNAARAYLSPIAFLAKKNPRHPTLQSESACACDRIHVRLKRENRFIIAKALRCELFEIIKAAEDIAIENLRKQGRQRVESTQETYRPIADDDFLELFSTEGVQHIVPSYRHVFHIEKNRFSFRYRIENVREPIDAISLSYAREPHRKPEHEEILEQGSVIAIQDAVG